MTGASDRFVGTARRLALVFFVLATLLAAWMIGWSHETTGSLRSEALKLILQFLLITGLGGILAPLLSHIRDALKEQHDSDRAAEAERRKIEVEAEADRRKQEREADKERRQEERDADAERRRQERELETQRRQEERDEQARQQLRLAALQDIDAELSRSYRRFKILKRQLRALCLECPREGEQVYPPYKFDRDQFERKMDELLESQIRLECLRDDLRSRTDILGKKSLRLIRRRLRYAARFYHDVYEDFERNRVVRDGEFYNVGENCRNIANFLAGGKLFPSEVPGNVVDSIRDYVAQLRSGNLSRREQHEWLDRINQERKSTKQRQRFRYIADDSFALASEEIRDQIKKVAKLATDDNEAPAVSNRSNAVPEAVEENLD